jgi:hypothetical protein
MAELRKKKKENLSLFIETYYALSYGSVLEIVSLISTADNLLCMKSHSINLNK